MSRNKENRDKLVQERLKQILDEILRSEDNRYCADCNSKGPRWASHNLGVFVCIRCAGIHRNLGVHISKVKSVALDSWTPDQVAIMKEMGNSRGRAIYEAGVHDGFHRPQSDIEVERLIRDKYDKKKYIAKDWKPSLNKPDVASLGLDDIMFGRKTSKSSIPTSTVVLPPPGTALSPSSSASASASLKQKLAISPSNPDRMAQVKAGVDAAAPASSAAASSAASATTSAASSLAANNIDLLGLSLDEGPTRTTMMTTTSTITSTNDNDDKSGGEKNDDDDDDFGNFLAAPSKSAGEGENSINDVINNNNNINSVVVDNKDPKSKDSIMALFPSIPQNNSAINNSQNFGGMSVPMGLANNFGGVSGPTVPSSSSASYASYGGNVMAPSTGGVIGAPVLGCVTAPTNGAPSGDLLGLGQAPNDWLGNQTPHLLGQGVPLNNGAAWLNGNPPSAVPSTYGMTPVPNAMSGKTGESSIVASAANAFSGTMPGGMNVPGNGMGSIGSNVASLGSNTAHVGTNMAPVPSNATPVGGSFGFSSQPQSSAFQSANPFFHPPGGTGVGVQPQPGSQPSTQVSWASSSQLQQQLHQQQFMPQQGYQQQQQYLHYQQHQQATFSGTQSGLTTNQTGNVTNQFQMHQQTSHQQTTHHVQQQQMVAVKPAPSGGFNSLANSSISFLD